MKIWAMVVVLALAPALVGFAGCETKPTATESDRQLNDMNAQIGAALLVQAQVLQDTAAQLNLPELKAQADMLMRTAVALIFMGKDLQSNAATLTKNLIGAPEQKTIYSPATAGAARGGSDKDHTPPAGGGFWGSLASTALIVGGTLLGGGAAIPLIRTLAPRFMAGMAGKALAVVVEGIARTREAAANPAAPITADRIIADQLKAQDFASDAVGALIRNVAHEAEAKLAARQ